jgi:hypothetical protein
MNKLDKMLDEFFVDSDRFAAEYYNETGELIISQESFNRLSTILKEGLEIYNKVIEDKMFSDDLVIQTLLSEVGKEAQKIEINEENAKKLNTRNAMEVWEDLHAGLVTLAIFIKNAEEDNNNDDAPAD